MSTEKKRQALETLRSLLDGKGETFHSPDKEPYIRVVVKDHKENYRLEKKGDFAEWCQHLFFLGTGMPLPDVIFKEMLAQLQAQAKFASPEFQTPLRVAEQDGKIYLDLCNTNWECIEVTSQGWDVVSEPPVRFRRSPGMMALPVPQRGGKVQELFSYINVKGTADRSLVLAWLLATFRPSGPYPILSLHGAQGSAKTTTETILRRMIDPARANLSGVPRDERDILIATRHSHLIGFDNFSNVSDSLSDALCRIATGSGLTTRKLYTDDTQTIFNGCRPILLNGITDLATRGDLLDRMLVLYLPKIQETERREERILLQQFGQAQPRILGAMLDAVSLALRKVNRIKFPHLPRMADFAVWASAGAEALGFHGPDIIAAYERNQLEANFIALENAPAAVEIYRWASQQAGPWEGTCRQLLAQLNLIASDGVQRDQHWPKSARGLSAVLARCDQNLAAAGVTVVKLPREAGTGQRKYRISFVTPSQPFPIQDVGPSSERDHVTVPSQKSKQSEVTAV